MALNKVTDPVLVETEYDGSELFITFNGMVNRLGALDNSYGNLLNFRGAMVIPANLEDGWYDLMNATVKMTTNYRPDNWYEARGTSLKDKYYEFITWVVLRVEGGKVFIHTWYTSNELFGSDGTQSTFNVNSHFNVNQSNSGMPISLYGDPNELDFID